MISSCAECRTKCCRTGEPPYRKVSMEDWLRVKHWGSKRYGIACEHFTDDEKCGIWDEAPIICRIFVCGVRTFTKEELDQIDQFLGKPPKPCQYWLMGRFLLCSFLLVFASCATSPEPKEDSSEPRGPVMIADAEPEVKMKRKKSRASRKTCKELYDLLFNMNDFHAMSQRICIARAEEKCMGEFDCFAQKATLCQEKYFRNQYSYMKRFRKRKCWRELNASEAT